LRFGLALHAGKRRKKGFLPRRAFPISSTRSRRKNPFESSPTMTLRKISTALLLSLAGVLLVPTASASPVATGTRAGTHRPLHRHGHRPAPKPKPKPAPQNAN
jgi:hypothetical protein